MNEAALACSGGTRARRNVSYLTDLLVVLLLLSVGICLNLYPYAFGLRLPGDLGDSSFILSMLEFFYRSIIALLQGKSANFVDAPFFYPWPRVTNFSDTFWGDAAFYAGLRAIGLGMLSAFQAWFVVGFALTYVSTFVSLRKLAIHSWGAGLGAFLFTFCLPMSAQVGHAQLVYRLWVPPAVVALHRFLSRGSLSAGAACVLFIALQLAVSIYLGLFLCLLLAAYTAALWIGARTRMSLSFLDVFRPTGIGDIVVAGVLLVLGLIVLGVVGLPYYEVQSMYGFTRSWTEVAEMLPRPSSYLLTGVSELWPNFSDSIRLPAIQEHQIFPGLSAIVPIAWFSIAKRARARQQLAIPMLTALAMLFAVTIDLGGYTAYWFVYQIPGFSVVRAVTRIVLVAMLPLSVLLGLMIDDLTAVRERYFRLLLALILAIFVVLECSWIGHYSTAPSVWREHLQALERRLPQSLPVHAVVAIASQAPKPGYDWSWIWTQSDADLAAATLGISTMNGYSGNTPPTWKTMTTCRDVADNLRAGRYFLAEHGMNMPAITRDQLVLVGFDTCNITELIHDPTLQLDQTYYFTPGAEGNQFLGGGFSDPESWGRWTDATESYLHFSLKLMPVRPISVAIEASAMSPAADRRQIAYVSANGHSCGQWLVTATDPHAEVICPTGTLQAEDNTLLVKIVRPARPRDVALSADSRLLGLGLKALRLTVRE